MAKLRIVWTGIVFLFVSQVTSATAAPFLVGTWYGQGQPYDKHEMWVARMSPDGEFHAQFRTCLKGQAFDQFNSGNWSLEGDVETIVVSKVNDTPSLRTDVYKILSHDSKSQTYRYLPTGFVYTSRRVDDKFELPSCETIS